MNVELQAIAARLGITEYPEALDTEFEKTKGQIPELRIKETLAWLHSEYDPFGGYYEQLVQGAEALERDSDLLTWLSLGYSYCKDASEKEAAAFPLPAPDDSPARDAFPSLLISLEYPETVKRYRARGFDEAAIKKNLGNLGLNLGVRALTEGRAALGGLYGWVTHYTKARIFDFMGFNFQPIKWKDEAILLKHRESGELVFLMLRGSFTATGTLVGLRGAEEVPAAVEVTLEETDDAFFGYRAEGQRIRTERERFDKREWEAALRPGDDVINFHMPRGCNLKTEHVEESMRLGAALTARFYPECDFKYIVCTSWMLDPKMLDFLPDSSNIARFIRHFLLHPSFDTAGNACMSYVFPGEKGEIAELPENTSLQRGIKHMMQNNSFTFWTTGIWV